MKSIRDYSLARLMIVGFALGIVISTLHLTFQAVFPSSDWTPLLTGASAGLLVAGMFAYFSTGGRDSQLMPGERTTK